VGESRVPSCCAWQTRDAPTSATDNVSPRIMTQAVNVAAALREYSWGRLESGGFA
jgi:hypothetical protein